ncbi:MAG: hypothetical protein ACRCR5_05830, partial [Lactococcus garvieae]
MAQNDYEPKLPSLEADDDDDDDDEDSVRIIQLMKSKEPLVSFSGVLKYLPASLYSEEMKNEWTELHVINHQVNVIITSFIIYYYLLIIT